MGDSRVLQNSKLEPAYGTDLLRIWVASVDSSRDVLIGPGILAQTFDGFRKIRNTARFLLGNLGQEKKEEMNVQDLGLVSWSFGTYLSNCLCTDVGSFLLPLRSNVTFSMNSTLWIRQLVKLSLLTNSIEVRSHSRCFDDGSS